MKVKFISIILIAIAIVIVILTLNSEKEGESMWLSYDKHLLEAVSVTDIQKKSEIDAGIVFDDENVQKSLSKNEIEKIVRLIEGTNIKTILKNPGDSDYDQSDNYFKITFVFSKGSKEELSYSRTNSQLLKFSEAGVIVGQKNEELNQFLNELMENH